MKIFNTKCEKCIFKINDQNKQIGCRFDVENIITKNYPGLYDKNNFIKTEDYWTIKNFRCPYARTSEWLEVLKNTTSEDEIDKVLLDSVVPYYLVIFLNSNEDSIDDIIKESLLSNAYHPVYISIILTNQSIYTPKKLAEWLEQQQLPKWKIHYIVDDKATISEMIDMSLDTNLNNTNASYIVIKYGETIYKASFLQRINELVSHCIGKQISVITDNFLDGFMIDKGLYNSLNNQIGVVYDYIINDETIKKIKIL